MSSAGCVFAFDLDDTLVSESDYVESGLRSAGAMVDAMGGDAESAVDWLVGLWRREHARDAFQRLIAARGLDAELWLPRLKEAYRCHAPEVELRAGAREVLTTLAERGVRLALVSDGYLDVQRRKWASLTLPCRFDPVVFTDEKGRAYWKPHPWGFEQVMAAHPDASRFFYVADNCAKDFIAPNSLGWTTVMICDPANLHPRLDVATDAAPRVTLDAIGRILELE